MGPEPRGQADVFIRASLAGTRYRVEIHPDLDSFQARALLRRRSALAVCPSLVDNYPLTVLECIMDGVPLVAANTGGIPEMISPSAIFEPTPRALAAMLEGSASGWVTFDDYYDPVESALRWGRVSTPGAAAVGRLADNFAPHVSVIMPHYNYGEYIEQAVQACLEQDYPNLEIVVIDDGSTDQDASDALDRLSKLDKRVRILRQENSGPSSARNNAAREAQGEYLVFVDADNIPRPNMITTLVRSARSADLDIVSCHFWAFARQRKGPASMPESINYRYTPVGPALEVGALENVFGDTNFLVKRQVFLDEGGFPVDDFSNQGGVEDWEFLARATLRGRSLDVVPEPLFWYRIGGTRTATSKPYLGRRAVLRHYAEELAPRIPWLFHSVMYAFAFRYTEKHQYALALQGEAPFARLPFISRNLLRLTTRLDAFLLRRFPAGSRVRRAAKSLFRQSR
ncbi:MAG: glycosyltransferase [Devosia sp.]